MCADPKQTPPHPLVTRLQESWKPHAWCHRSCERVPDGLRWHPGREARPHQPCTIKNSCRSGARCGRMGLSRTRGETISLTKAATLTPNEPRCLESDDSDHGVRKKGTTDRIRMLFTTTARQVLCQSMPLRYHAPVRSHADRWWSFLEDAHSSL